MVNDYREIAALLEDGAYDCDTRSPMLADAMRSGARACRDYQAQAECIRRLLALTGTPCLKSAVAKLEAERKVMA